MSKYTIESLKEINQSYDYNHRVYESDVEKANKLVALIEGSREKESVQVGDIIEFTGGTGDYYGNSHVESVYDDGELHICHQGYAPFTNANSKGGISTSTSGGPWATIPGEVKYIGKRNKMFKAWGHRGATANGAFYFEAEVNVFEYIANEALRFTTKTHDKYYVYVNKEELTYDNPYKYTVSSGAYSKTAFKTDEEYQAWLKTYQGVEFKGNWHNQIIVWTLKQDDKCIPLEDYLKIENAVIDSTMCNGKIQECKRVYKGTKVTTYLPYQKDMIVLEDVNREYMNAYQN